MAVLEIQANGDTAVSKEAVAYAGESLEDPLMRVSTKFFSFAFNHNHIKEICLM